MFRLSSAIIRQQDLPNAQELEEPADSNTNATRNLILQPTRGNHALVEHICLLHLPFHCDYNIWPDVVTQM
jgi:hypothetical protein